LEKSALSTELQYAEAQALWLVDTSPLPVIGQSYTAAEAPWLVDTFLLPAERLPAKGQVSREAGRSKLKPPQLQPYIPHTPYPSRIPITDPGVESQFLERLHDHSTIFEDKVI